MGTKIEIENYMPGHYSMRDLSRESNGASWPSSYGDNNLANGQFYYGFLPRPFGDLHPEYDKDVVKQTMLEHEAIFKNQVYELHRLYRVQRNLMDEVRRKEQFTRQPPYEASSSSSPVPSQMQLEDVQRWNGSSLPKCKEATLQSSLHTTKGKNVQHGPSPFQNCYSPRNSEVSESRPTKCRRRMLDLQLPADDYIDTDEVEQFSDAKVSSSVIPSPDNNRADFGKSKVLADLNEPAHMEETTVASHLDFLGRAGSQHDVQCRDLSNKLLSSLKDAPQNSPHGNLNGTLSNAPFENGCNTQNWFSYALGSEQLKGGFRSINQGIHEQKLIVPPQVLQVSVDQACQPPAFLTGDHTKADLWRVKCSGIVEKSDRSYHPPSYNIPEQIRSSHLPNQSSFFHHSDLGKSWDQCASSWGKPSSFLDQRSTQIQASPFVSSVTLTKSPHSSAQSNDLFGNKWNLNSIPGDNAAFGAELSFRNGLYQGASASFRGPPVCSTPVAYDYRNCDHSDKKIPVRNVNLNVALPDVISKDHVNHKSEDPPAVLPWLRGKGSCQNEAQNSRTTDFRGLPFASSSCDAEVKAKKPDSNGCTSSRKILGVPIFESPSIVKKENSAIVGPSALDHRPGKEEFESNGRRLVFDMNLPCDPELTDSEPLVEEVLISEKKMQTESSTLRNNFDLNSCITEEETPCGTSLLDNNASIKGGTGIDLEAPVIIESDEEPLLKEPEKQPEREDDGEPELAKSAALAIVVMSSSLANPNPSEGEGVLEDALLWFVEIACSSGNDLETRCVPDEEDRNGDKGGCSPRVLDDFESMTLSLKECSFEEYFPKPSFPEISNLEETSGRSLLAPRTRKGQARRGRQRRDFQRDILPGLLSLSRHEVTEDLQTFGGLMRATGHPWQFGPNRRNATRNGCGRGRRRSVVAAPAPENTVSAPPLKQHISNTEVILEDRSLTGWGKTTRRPRRQRYPAGNPPLPVPLS